MPIEFFDDGYTSECPNEKTALMSPQFWYILGMLSLSTSNLLFIYGIAVEFLFAMAYKEVGVVHGYGDTFLTVIGCLCSISNCSGRITWGRLYEFLPFKKLYSILLIGQTIFPLTLPLVAPNPMLFAIWVICAVFFPAGNFTIFPPYATKVFGMGIGGVVYSYAASSFAVAAIILFFGNMYVIPLLGYDNLLALAGILSSINYLLIYLFNENPKWPITQVTLRDGSLKRLGDNLLGHEKELALMGNSGKVSLERAKSII